jgi:hypothetical protein
LILLTAWDVVLGFALVSFTVGWTAARRLMSRTGAGGAHSRRS